MQARFDFVTETGKQRLKDRDAATQHIIRKRATQAAAATKKQEGKGGRVNLIQYPPGIDPDNAATRADLTARGKPSDRTPIRTRLKDRAKGYAARSKQANLLTTEDSLLPHQQAFDASYALKVYCPNPILSPEQLVSLLSSLKLQESLIGRRNRPDLTIRDKNTTRKIVRLTNDDFVTLLVDRYGQNKTLDAAIDCLGARTRQLLGGPVQSNPEEPSFLYGRALQVMKREIDALAMQSPSFEAKLAILALALYELLNTSSDQKAWILHSNGAAVVLQKAGPKSMNNDLQKTFLMIIAPVIGAEAILGGRNCFLAQPDWQEAMESTINWNINNPFDDRSELFVTFRMLFVCVPNLFNEVGALVYDGAPTDIDYLRSRIQGLKGRFNMWQHKWSSELYQKFKDVKAEDRRLYALCVCLMNSAILDRLMIAISLDTFRELEDSATQLAREILDTKNHTYLSRDEANVRVAFMAVIAEAILSTSGEWEMSCLYGLETGRGTVEPHVFADWCQKLGRPVPEIRFTSVSSSSGRSR